MKMQAVMVLGTTSGAGKSWLATALCRWYRRAGLRVAPFKAQNMSNNARVVNGLKGEAGEIGSAQYFQALAAGVAPDVRMNPVLLKPERDTASQVVVLGQVRAELASIPWRERSKLLWPYARDALCSLAAANDVVVIEGAGSPAEINLAASDFVNIRTAREADAACLLITDIDRGGAFAHLFGTYQLLKPPDRSLIRGFVLNRFRGDPALLAPGPEQLRTLTGVPTVAVLPMWFDHGLPEEDAVFDDAPTTATHGQQIAVITYPRISNLDEFQPLRRSEGVGLKWARQASDLVDVDWIVLPGSKHTSGDLAWLRERGLDRAIVAHARAGKRVLGICGGLQMLGEELRDPYDIDGEVCGLGLLPLTTSFARTKLLRMARAQFINTSSPWSALNGVHLEGYEIHHGATRPSGLAMQQLKAVVVNDQEEAIGWQKDSVLGLYMHGIFESPAILNALFGVNALALECVFDRLADFIDQHFEPGILQRLITRAG